MNTAHESDIDDLREIAMSIVHSAIAIVATIAFAVIILI